MGIFNSIKDLFGKKSSENLNDVIRQLKKEDKLSIFFNRKLYLDFLFLNLGVFDLKKRGSPRFFYCS